MEETMLLRLKTAKKRLAEIDELLMDENATRDINNFRTLSKERSTLEPQVAKFDEYLLLDENKKQAFEMSQDSDNEISEMGKEEYKALCAQEEELIEEIRIMLIPKDPNDDKNIIVEIRGAVGGDEANIFAGDLFRMYVKYAETQGWKMQL